MARHVFTIIIGWVFYLTISYILTKAFGYAYMEIVTANIDRESVEEAMSVITRLDSGVIYIHYTSSFIAFAIVAMLLVKTNTTRSSSSRTKLAGLCIKRRAS